MSKRKGRPNPTKTMPGQQVIASPKNPGSENRISPTTLLLSKLGTRWAAVPVCIAILATINTLWNQYASDDTQQVLGNTFIRDLRNIPLAFTSTVWSYVTEDIAMTTQPYFRPMFSVLFTLTYAAFGSSAWGWHLVNVLVHAGVALILFMVLREATEDDGLALMGSGLFAAHPAHAESVAWISGVTDPLMALFLLPSFYCFLRFRKTGRKVLIGLSLVLYLLAMLSKETAIALLPIVAIYEALQSGPGLRRRFLRATGYSLLFLVPTAVYLLMRLNGLGSILFSGTGPRFSILPAILSVPLVTLKYLGLMVVPWGYSYQHYTPFVESAADLRFLVPALVLALTAALIWRLRSPLVTFSAIWFIVTLGPALAALRQFDPEYLVQERYLYLPSMGFCLAAALGLRQMAQSRLWAAPKVALVLFTAIVLVWGFVHVRQNRVWYDTRTLFENCVAVDPRLPTAHISLSGTLFSLGKHKEAEAAAAKALELDPASANAYLNLSYIALRSGKVDEAISYLERGAQVVQPVDVNRPNLASIYLNLGLLYSQQKQFDRTEQALLRSMEIWPRPTAWWYAGQFYFQQNRYSEAKRMFDLAAGTVPPNYAPIHLALAQVHERLGRRDEARAEYQKYLELAPPNAKDRAEAMRRLSQL